MIQRILAVLFAATLTAQAWGPEGHEVVGRIAEKNLTPAALQAVTELLTGTNTLTIADDGVANWPDHIRRGRPETGPWHFVDIPFAAEKFDPQRDCLAHSGCVVTAIEQFQTVLADKQTNTAARVEALKFLVHFVGDIHQPLHCAERDGDQGGNKCLVLWPGDPAAAKLHVVWDVFLVNRCLSARHRAAVGFADLLNAPVTPEQKAVLATGTPAEWAWESHQLAVTKVYPGIAATGDPTPLTDEYLNAGQVIVEAQLLKAGLRLARLLNSALP